MDENWEGVDVNKRMKEIKDQCVISDIKIVYDSQDKSHHLYWKIEKLVHPELQNFRKILNCGRHMKANGGPTDHGKRFAVPEGVALETVRRWRDFVKGNPYDENGTI